VREYGRIHSAFWSSEDMRALTDDGRMLALYLMSCPHATIAGVFRLPDGYVCEDLQWTAERVSEGFRNLLSKGFANRCETTKWVWICKHLEWNPPENPNQRKGAQKAAMQVPDECAWKPAFMRVCGPSLGLRGAETTEDLEPLRKGSETLATESESESESDKGNGLALPTVPSAKPKRPRSPAKSLVPDDFLPTESVATRLKAEFGLSPGDLDRCVRVFRDQCKAKGYTYADPQAAFANCVRGDWQGCRTRAAATPAAAGASFAAGGV